MDYPARLPDADPAGLREFMRSRLSPKRALHVLGVESEAAALAMRWNADVTAARQAALLHDITKESPSQLNLGEFCGIIPSILKSVPEECRHAVTGAALAARWNMPEEIVLAVRWHTTGRPEMGMLEKILFLADMTEPSRTLYPGLMELRRAVYEDIDGALRAGLRLTLEHALSKGEADGVTRRALDWAKNH